MQAHKQPEFQPDIQPDMNNKMSHLKGLQRTTPDGSGALASTKCTRILCVCCVRQPYTYFGCHQFYRGTAFTSSFFPQE